MEPDLSWWALATNENELRACFVGDGKYKKLDTPGFRHADIYQMLAYCTAADLPVKGGAKMYHWGGAKPYHLGGA